MKRRWRPKDFLPPKSRRAREAAAARRHPDVRPLFEIMKELWPQGPIEMKRPLWARIARKFGWMLEHDYWAVRPEPTGKRVPCISELLYAQSPFIGMVNKTSNFRGAA